MHLVLSLPLTLNFQSVDWVEFSPYEIGMAKYGTFMTPDLFGSKFFMGTVVKKYEENPLHFLMGKKDVCTHNRVDEISTMILTVCFRCVRCVGECLLHSLQQSAGSQRHSWWQHNGGGVR